MTFQRKILEFCAGGLGYVGLELAFRGRSHSSMFAAGGLCFLLIGSLEQARAPLPQPLRSIAGAGIITAVELGTGLAVNRDHCVWDYRNLPGNWRGQICLPFSLLWMPVSAAAGQVYLRLDRALKQ